MSFLSRVVRGSSELVANGGVRVEEGDADADCACADVEAGRAMAPSRGFGKALGCSSPELRLDVGRDTGAEDKAFIANDRTGGGIVLAVSTADRAGLFRIGSLAVVGLFALIFGIDGAFEALGAACTAVEAVTRAVLINGMIVAFDAGLRFDV